MQTHWYPVASSSDLVLRHVYQAELLGHEYALWRADDGNVNLWENRCLHRGVRLSIGINDGRELKCQYHGWRYANGTGGCTYIPAHPADAPARTVNIKTYPSIERYGLIWAAATTDVADDVQLPWFDENPHELLALRPIPINAPAEYVLEQLKNYRFAPVSIDEVDHSTVQLLEADSRSVRLSSTFGNDSAMLSLFVQPVTSGHCVVRGLLRSTQSTEARMTILRQHNWLLSEARTRIETELGASLTPPPKESSHVIQFQPHPESDKAVKASGAATGLRVSVKRKWNECADVMGFELVAVEGLLPTAQPGAHIDVRLPNGVVRQYSIVNGPGESASYFIGVKREPDSRGGSECLHEVVREGDLLAISAPRNNFPLRRDAEQTILIAGGIGVTPLCAMAQALQHQGLNYELHHFARSADHLAFANRLAQAGVTHTQHLGLDPDATGKMLSAVMGAYAPSKQVYICGPGPMLSAARDIAAENGWPDEAVHFEYFANDTVIDDSTSFEISLARSNLSLTVNAGETILDVLRANGVDLPSSCEQGACGTCMVEVLEGEPFHQDVYLNNEEKQAGKKIMTCVSRAQGKHLVLDI